MADTAVETVAKNTITITFTGAGAAWDSKINFPNGLRVLGIAFIASNAADVLKLRNGSATAPIVYVKTNSGYDFLFGADWNPYFLVTDQSFNTIANCSITFFVA